MTEVHQVLADLSPGDAISNHAIFLRDTLTALGFESRIVVRNLNIRTLPFAKTFSPGDVPSRAALLYHHSIGSDLTAAAIAHSGSKALIYHNITPSEFYRPWDAKHAQLLERGHMALHSLAAAFPVSSGVSEHNANDLLSAGF